MDKEARYKRKEFTNNSLEISNDKIVFFDDVCNFCNILVDIIRKYNSKKKKIKCILKLNLRG